MLPPCNKCPIDKLSEPHFPNRLIIGNGTKSICKACDTTTVIDAIGWIQPTNKRRPIQYDKKCFDAIFRFDFVTMEYFF